ncbi:glycosyltransferase family 1 protein [bacterium]|nr:glycosyltransferase family 1 protein [bacterium]
MMKLLIVGSNSKWAIENEFMNHLNSMCEVSFFNAHGIFLEVYHKSIMNKILFRLGFSTLLNRLNNEILQMVDKRKINAVLVFKGMEVFPSTLKQLRQKGIKLFNYNPDHPFEFFGRGSGNAHVKNGIPHYDHHFSYSKNIIKDLQSTYRVSASWLPFGYARHAPLIQNVKEELAVCFIGNPDVERANIIHRLVENDIPVHVYGNGWGSFLKASDLLRIYEAVYDSEFVNVAQRYRVQLNLFRPHNLGSHNMRTFEMPAISCLSLAPYSEEQNYFFRADKEAFYYKTLEEAIEKCKMILQMKASEVECFKMEAYNRAIELKCSYFDRSLKLYQTMLTFLKN